MKKHLSVFSLLLFFLHQGAAAAADDITQQVPTVDRAEVDQALSDLNNRLTEGRAVPHFENGKPAGYKVAQPQPGSTYEKLELKNGDVIQEVSGQKINDPQKAFEMMGSRKKSNQIKVVRDGTEHTVEHHADGDAVESQKDQAQ